MWKKYAIALGKSKWCVGNPDGKFDVLNDHYKGKYYSQLVFFDPCSPKAQKYVVAFCDKEISQQFSKLITSCEGSDRRLPCDE